MSTLRRAACLLLAGCLLGGLLGGCDGSATGAAPDPTGEWELVELWRGSTVQPAPLGGRTTLTVGDGTFGGASYCNEYGGDYRLQGDELSIGDLASTERGCEPELMTAEAAYLEALGAVERVGSRDGYLVLTGPDIELRFRPVVPVPASELAGTGWVLETLLDGAVAASTTGGPAELVLAADGTLTGSTGCRPFLGQWALDGDVVRVTGFAAEGSDCPPEVSAQDEHVTRVLDGEFQVTVAGESLTLTGPDGLGLVYRG